MSCVGKNETCVPSKIVCLWANENSDLTAELLTVGMTYDEVKAVVSAHPLEQRTSVVGLGPGGKRNTVLGEALSVSPSHQTVVMTHLSDIAQSDGRLLRVGETILIFKDGVLASKELSGFRWDKIEPLSLDGGFGLAASEWSGGAHCCFTYTIVDLKSTPTIVQTLGLKDSPGKILPCGERTCVYLTDTTFAYWRGPFVSSIHVDVVLSLRGRTFQFDSDLMRNSGTGVSQSTASEIRQAFQKAEQDTNFDEAYRMLGQELLFLIYAGRAIEAEDLVRRVWPRNQEAGARQSFMHEFITRLKSSPYWNDLMLLSGGSILGVKE